MSVQLHVISRIRRIYMSDLFQSILWNGSKHQPPRDILPLHQPIFTCECLTTGRIPVSVIWPGERYQNPISVMSRFVRGLVTWVGRVKPQDIQDPNFASSLTKVIGEMETAVGISSLGHEEISDLVESKHQTSQDQVRTSQTACACV